MENKTMMQYFEWYLPPDDLLWRRTGAQAKSLKEAGVDMLWLPPAYKGAGGVNDAGYGVYDLYDLGEFDQKGSVPTKYGTRQEYLRCIKDAQKAGVQVLADIVLNQRLGADEVETVRAVRVDNGNRNNQTTGTMDIGAWTRFTFPGRGGKYSDFVWTQDHFTGTDWDEYAKQEGIFRWENKGWSDKVSHELGNYDYLMGVDVDVRNPYVEAELIKWGCWYLEQTAVDGYRLDALKHIDYGFLHDWLGKMRTECGRDLFAVGEYWSGNLADLEQFLHDCGYCLTLFDVPLHMNFHSASESGGNYDMANLFQNTLVQKNGDNAVTFVDNHDSQPGQALQSWVQDWFKPLAYASILLRQGGLPCVFYCDYYGRRGDGLAPVPGLRRMMHVRKWYAYGEQHDYLDHPDIIGWTREGDDEHENSGLAVVLTDRDQGQKTMYIGKRHAGRQFRDVLRREMNPIEVREDGTADFATAGGGVSIWVPKEAYECMSVFYE